MKTFRHHQRLAALRTLQAASPELRGKAAIRNENEFAVLMEATEQ